MRASNISECAIQKPNRVKADKGLTNITFEVQDATSIPARWTRRFGLVLVYDVIHDLRCRDLGLHEIHRAIKGVGAECINDVNLHTKVKDNVDNPRASVI